MNITAQRTTISLNKTQTALVGQLVRIGIPPLRRTGGITAAMIERSDRKRADLDAKVVRLYLATQALIAATGTSKEAAATTKVNKAMDALGRAANTATERLPKEIAEAFLGRSI